MRYPNGKTKILGIIGHPVGHSLSPAMQNAALTACGLNYCYVPFDVHPGHLDVAVAGLRALGVSGFNVTIPHKAAVLSYLDELDESAEAAGAVNTVHNDNGRLVGYNTDGDGLVRSLSEDLGFNCTGAGTIILIGAGGAARGAVAALCRAGATRIVIVNRSRDKARTLAEIMGNRYRGTEVVSVGDAGELLPYLGEAVLLVNTTSLGMNQEKLPFLKLTDMSPAAMIYDMVYEPPITPLLRDAAECGLRNANGLGMLAAQGEYAFHIWTGIRPPTGVMKSVFSSVCTA